MPDNEVLDVNLDPGVSDNEDLDLNLNETEDQDLGDEHVADDDLSGDQETGDGQHESDEGEQELDEEKGKDEAGEAKLPEIKVALSKLKEIDPKASKTLRAAYSREQQYKEAFPTPAEAKAVKSQFEAVGGVEGLATVQQEAADFAAEKDLVANGDPQIIKDLFTSSPDGVKKLVPHILEELRTADGKAYESAIQPHLVDKLEQVGFVDVMSSIAQALESTNLDEAKKLARNSLAWFAGQKRQAEEGRVTRLEPERQKLKGEWSKLEAEKNNSFNTNWKTQHNEYLRPRLHKAMLPYLNGLTDAQKLYFGKAIITAMNERFNTDKSITSQSAGLLRSRDAKRTAEFFNSKADMFLNDIVKETASLQRLTAGKVKKQVKGRDGKVVTPPATGIGSSPKVPIFLKQRPNTADIDLSKDPERTFMTVSKAFMKSGPYKGRWITWRPRT